MSALRERRDLARELYEAQPLCWGEELLDLHELPSEVATLAVEVWLDSVKPRSGEQTSGRQDVYVYKPIINPCLKRFKDDIHDANWNEKEMKRS